MDDNSEPSIMRLGGGGVEVGREREKMLLDRFDSEISPSQMQCLQRLALVHSRDSN